MNLFAQGVLYALIALLFVCAGCSRCGREEVGPEPVPLKADSEPTAASDLAQISLGVGVEKFLAAAGALLNVPVSANDRSRICQPQLDLGVPDLDAEVIQARGAGGRTIESCLVKAEGNHQSSTLVMTRGEFLDGRLVKVTHILRSTEFDSTASELNRRLGEGRQIDLAEQTVLEDPRSTPYLVWESGQQVWLQHRNLGGAVEVARQDLSACGSLPMPSPPSERGKPVSLEDLGIGKLDLTAEGPDVRFNDAGEIIE